MPVPLADHPPAKRVGGEQLRADEPSRHAHAAPCEREVLTKKLTTARRNNILGARATRVNTREDAVWSTKPGIPSGGGRRGEPSVTSLATPLHPRQDERESVRLVSERGAETQSAPVLLQPPASGRQMTRTTLRLRRRFAPNTSSQFLASRQCLQRPRRCATSRRESLSRQRLAPSSL